MVTVVAAPGPGPGNWSGAASVVLHEGTFWMAYRERRPLDAGRGVAVVLARSDDGLSFTEVCRVDRHAFGAASLERPALVPLSGGGWRLYLSCATPESKHWWVDSLTAASCVDLPDGRRRMVLSGDSSTAVKDPVIIRDGTRWRMWVCTHPLDVVGAEDRMTTHELSSSDGLRWTEQGMVLAGRRSRWDERGARMTAVLRLDPLAVAYDGRPDAASNWEETTGVAVGPARRTDLGAGSVPLTPLDGIRVTSAAGGGAWRYAAVVDLPRGGQRWYVEVARPDGAHDLQTALVPGGVATAVAIGSR